MHLAADIHLHQPAKPYPVVPGFENKPYHLYESHQEKKGTENVREQCNCFNHRLTSLSGSWQ